MNNNIYKIALLATAFVLFAVALYVYRPQSPSRYTRITVVGDSQTKIAPDTAIITFSVVTQNSQAVNAQQENARKSEAVKLAVEALFPNAKPEIKTNDYNLSPQQDYSGKMPKIAGYEVRNTVTVSVTDKTQTGAVIDAATKAGANSVEGINFVLGESSPAQGDALSLATKQALAKAEAIAKSLNGRIVRVVESSEGGIAPRPNSDLLESSMNSNSAANAPMEYRRSYNTPVQAGSLNVRSQVVLIVEIETKLS